MKKLLLAIACLAMTVAAAEQVQAAVVNIGYTFDGTNMTLNNGPSLFTQSMSAGDIINLTYTADGTASFWDFSNVGSIFGTNLGFLSDSFGNRASQGNYEAMLDGVTVLQENYSVPAQGSVHLGPDYVDYTGVGSLDFFTISYEMVSTTSPLNNVGAYSGQAQPWQIWDLFGLTHQPAGGVTFTFVPDPPAASTVPEPSSLAILGIGACVAGVGARRRQRVKREEATT